LSTRSIKTIQIFNNMNSYSGRFTRDGYAVMRHAHYFEGQSGIELCRNSVKIGRRNIQVLVTHELEDFTDNPNVVVSIFYSPLRRAELTAQMVRSEFACHNIPVSNIQPVQWLGCEDGKEGSINANMNTVCSEGDLHFSFFITHMPNMCNFIGSAAWEPCSCSIITRQHVIVNGRLLTDF